jgi:hypothetical protein
MPAVHDRVRISGVPLGGRVHTAFARARLAQALHEIALDALDPAPTLGVEELEWLRRSFERPIGVATEAALGTFTAELEAVLLGHAGGASGFEVDDDRGRR